ncbi:putative ABC transporter, ATP-binding protein [Desulfonema limicola]|uniref:ABC transporter, ATP-binding protein n=1 Tax=Desulfonema limicola TaxID=45656 RepID=A0A975GIQ4_9BACT|nr:energy-coupling factor ABC transporter ATP-binding protein [Desulfonema limicola]QTA82691.1 putative ABC transporter, ATP-binding protein [Desulfonema limicola]
MKGLVFRNLFFHKTGPINLEIKPGECIGISGHSGAGKSLFLRAAADMDMHSGLIYLNNVESKQISAHQWRKKIGLLPAESCWWFDTVGQHFKSLNSNDLLKSLGFDPDVMEWEISRLSSGEKQRLALLRLLANQPEALLLDEPTANLDTANILQAETIIKKYQADNNLPVIWVSHDKEQIKRISSRHFFMDKYKLSEL